MSTMRAEIIAKVWHGRDPFSEVLPGTYQMDLQGWGQHHRYLTETISHVRPAIVIEVGVWKGASTVKMASRIKELGIDSVVIGVDTWLGSWEHWLDKRCFDTLCFESGRPQLMRKFMQNVVASGLCDYVIPLPLDSNNAWYILDRYKIRPDMIHLDAGHDYNAVMNDLRLWWPTIRHGGVLIGDDYCNVGFPGVRKAFDEFFGALDLTPIEHVAGKCRISKPVPAAVT
jgi:hypothetical protein